MRLVLLPVLIFLIDVDGLHCPSLSYQPWDNSIKNSCWDGTDPTLGCCASGNPKHCSKSSSGPFCDCHGRCRGWSVDLSSKPMHNFKDGYTWKDYNKLYSIQGADGQCKMRRGFPNAISARVSRKSCVKLWEKPGCTGKETTLFDVGTITDVRRKGLVSGIAALSDCTFTPPKSAVVRLYNSNYYDGASLDMTVKHDECKAVEKRWEDKVRMIQPWKEGCYKIWERRNCTGASYCDCDVSDLLLYRVPMAAGSVSWDFNVKALSLCNYQSSQL